MHSKKLLVIGYTWPEPKATAAGKRMEQLLKFFLQFEYHITFSSTASASDLSLDLKALGIERVPIQLNDSRFDGFISELKPHIVLFDRFLTEEQFGWRVAEYAPDALRILDTEDLHSLRYAREKAFKAKVPCTKDFWLQTEYCKRELASIFRSDLSLIISTYEMQLLLETEGMTDSLLLYLPFMIAPLSEMELQNWKPFEARTDFICIGNGKHAPNRDAVIWLKETLWPLIRKQLPDTSLHIYGAYLPEHIQQFHTKKEGFLVHGWVEDLQTVMGSAKVNLAPLRFGAGLKGKLLDAMRHGTPSVTTAVGAEGIYDPLALPETVVEDATAFSKMAVGLYRHQEHWHEAQVLGIHTLKTCFDREVHRVSFRNRIQNLQSNLQSHRTQNVIGQLLLHQTLAATKYMAKWIEEKNKLRPI